MGRLTISNIVRGTIDGSEYTFSSSTAKHIDSGTDVTRLVGAAWVQLFGVAGVAGGTLVLINTGDEDALFRVSVDAVNYTIANLPAGSSAVLCMTENSAFLSATGGLKLVAVYSAAGTTIRAAFFA